MKLPVDWNLVEDCDSNFIFEKSDDSFCVSITFTEQCDIPYSINFSQLKGNFNLIGFEDGAYSTNATTKNEAIVKALEMMLFIDKLLQEKNLSVQ